MSNITELQKLLNELKATPQDRVRSVFTNMFERGFVLLKLTDQRAATVFDTSVPTITRWRNGLVPPAAGLILKFLQEEIETELYRFSSPNH